METLTIRPNSQVCHVLQNPVVRAVVVVTGVTLLTYLFTMATMKIPTEQEKMKLVMMPVIAFVPTPLVLWAFMRIEQFFTERVGEVLNRHVIDRI